MANLDLLLIKTRENIQKHREKLENKEENVRTAIINPILKSIGWDTGKLELVQQEKSHELGFPDYSLIKRNKIVLFIEAKRMGIEIGKIEDLGQILKYCSEKMVPFGVITNGSQWLLFKAFEKRESLTDSIKWKIDLEHDDPEIILGMLRCISRTAIDNIEESSKKLQKQIKNQKSLEEIRYKLMEDTWKKTIADRDQIIKAVSPIFKSHINKSDLTRYKIGDSQISEFVKGKISHYFRDFGDVYTQIERKSKNEPVHTTNPMILIIKGEKFPIRHQNQILIETANWLIRKGKLKKSNCPFSVSRGTRNLVNTIPVHKDNTPFVGPKPLMDGLFIETNSDYQNTKKYARELFEQFGYSGNEIQVE